MNNYKFDNGEDAENKCILMPRYRAGGRVAPDGKRYPDKEYASKNEEDYVPVRSIISKFTNPDIVTPDCISLRFKDLTPGTAIGSSFGSSLTEALTQGALALKHGGHERVIKEDAFLYAPKACKIVEDGKWLILDSTSGSDLKYPRPDNFIANGVQDTFKAGDIVGTAYNTSSPIIKLNTLINLIKATGNRGKRYYEKDTPISSECYAYEEGDIHYREEKNGSISVNIGDTRYAYNPNCMYYFPEGTHVKKFQRICSGVVDMSRVVHHFESDIQSIYIIFRKQFYSLIEGDYYDLSKFAEVGLGQHAVQEELCEMLFISLLNVDYNPSSQRIEDVKYLGTATGIRSNGSFYTMLSYGYANQVLKTTLKGNAEIKDDIMTETVLGLLLNNKLDE